MRGRVAMARRGRRTTALAVALPTTLMVTVLLAFTAPAAHAVTQATANLQGHVQNLNDTAGMNNTFVVTNTGTTKDDEIEVVRITRPSPVWTVNGCPKKPAGWTVTFNATSCTFQVGSGSPIPLGAARNFGVKARTSTAAGNQSGNYLVEVARCAPVGECPLVPTTGDTSITAFAWTVTNAKVFSEGVPAPGVPCNSVPNFRSDLAGGSATIVICGKNNTNVTNTVQEVNSSLSGSFITEPGSFTGGPIPAGSGDVVLGSWTEVSITSSPGTGKFLFASVGSDDGANSMTTTLWNYTAIAP